MKFELLIGRGTKMMRPPVIDGVTIDWQRKSQPGKLTFTVVKTPDLSFTAGDAVRFSVDNKSIFYGYVFDKTRSGLDEKKLSVVAYDSLYYLIKNKDSYIFENKTAADIIRMIAEDFHLKVGSITQTPYNIESLVCDNKSLYDMISESLSLTEDSTGAGYTLYDNVGKLTLANDEEMMLDGVLNKNNTGNFDYKTSIAESTYNRIKLAYDDSTVGVRQILFAEDPVQMANWGVLQYYEKADEDNISKTRALSLLSQHDSRTRTLSLKDVKGDTRVRAGSRILCIYGLGDMNLSKIMTVDQVRHVFKENEHFMDIKLEQNRPEVDVSKAVTGSLTESIPITDTGGEAEAGAVGSIRTTRPSNTNKYYVTVGGGGYNRCIPGNAANGRTSSTSVIPNCVGYVYGRYMESRGITSCNLPTCNAKQWYSAAKSRGFNCSQTPSAGCIACFGGTQYGHVVFVERVEANGDLYCSESNWSHSAFRNVTIYKSNGYNYSSGLRLIGFIS